MNSLLCVLELREHPNEITVGSQTGMRKGNQYALTWEDVNFKLRLITLPDTKTGVPHTVPMTDDVYEALKDQQNLQTRMQELRSDRETRTMKLDGRVFTIRENREWFEKAKRQGGNWRCGGLVSEQRDGPCFCPKAPFVTGQFLLEAFSVEDGSDAAALCSGFSLRRGSDSGGVLRLAARKSIAIPFGYSVFPESYWTRVSRRLMLGIEETAMQQTDPNEKRPSARAQVATRDKLLVGRSEAAQMLSISERALDYLVAKKQLTARRIGTRVLISVADLARFTRGDHPERLAG